MSAAAPGLRPAVHRCLTAAVASALRGDGERMRQMIALALDLATEAELELVLGAADRLLGGYAPASLAAEPAPPATPQDEPEEALAPAPAGRAPGEPAAEPAPAVSGPPPQPSPARAAPLAAPASAAPPPVAAPPTFAEPPRRRRRAPAPGMGKPLLSALLAGAVVWGAVSWFASRPVDLAEVERQIQRGETAAALDRLERVKPDDAAAQLLRGRALLVQGDTAAGAAALRAALGLDPAGATGRRAGALLRQMGSTAP